MIDTGARVPADCLVITSADLEVTEASSNNNDMALESYRPKQPVGPDDGEESRKDPFLYADSLIVRGKCKAVVC